MMLFYFLPTLLFLLAMTRSAAPDKSGRQSDDRVARMLHYSGMVQGVGFRATTAAIARSHPVTGWVKNLADGRVQLFVEGRANEVTRFLDAVRNHWQHYINDEEITEMPPTGDCKTFSIRY